MEKLKFSVTVNAPKEIVWDTMLNEDTYRKWTTPFHPQSSYVGDWSKGSKMRFTASGETGEMGMVSRIKDNRKYEFISIEHLGEFVNGKEEPKEWAGALENYTFKETNGKTEVIVDMDSNDEYKDMFSEMWPKALQKLKELAEEKVVKPV